MCHFMTALEAKAEALSATSKTREALPANNSGMPYPNHYAHSDKNT